MSAIELLTELSRQGVKLWADGDQLHCKAPKGMMTAGLRSKLTEYKAEILTFLSQDPTVGTGLAPVRAVRESEFVQTGASPVPTTPDPTQQHLPFPTTDVQQAYWIGRSATFELGNIGNHGYIEVEAANLDLARSLRVLRQLIKRHPMLRAIMLPDGQQQVLEGVSPFCIEYIDLSGLNQQKIAEQLLHIRQAMDHQVFQVEQWPALEIRLSCIQKQRVRIHASIESLFVDAWSIRILIQEFIHLYHEPETALPPLELSFRDYVLAEAQLQDSELYRRSQDYWAGRTGDLPSAPDLPLAIDPATLSRPHFVHREARMEAGLWEQLKARGVRAGLTPSGILLAAFAEVLTLWSKSPRFCINLTLFNRLPLHEDVNALVGDFTSLLMLAVDNSLSGSFEKRARDLQEQMWRDFDHRYYSGVRVLRDLARMRRVLPVQAMMPVVFTSLLAQETANKYSAPWQEIIYCVTQTPQVWLDHQVLEEGGNLLLYWQAVEALFPPGLLDTMFAAYTGLLQQLATDEEPWRRDNALRLSGELVPYSLLTHRTSINAAETPIAECLLHSFFLEQAAKRPNQLAVVSAKRTLTYQETLREAMFLGHQLRQLGARPNHLVAVVMEKGWEQVVGVLGVLLSGAAYLPIDPKFPQERVTWMLEHGEVEVLLTQSWVNERIAWPQNVKRICVDRLDLDEEDIFELASIQRSDDLAYVIYTSGSTGLPKGVMIDHTGAVNTILDINQRIAVTCEDRVLALSALNFDLSVYDIFGLLAAGGTIVMPAEDTLRNPAAWLDMIQQERVTLWNTVPALLQMLVEYTESHPTILPECLRLALLSGDWIPVALPDKLRKLIPEVAIISLGGATEASIWSIFYPIMSVESSWKSIPYGKPLCNQCFFVLNEKLEPCPVWVTGYLYIGGIGLAKGYWRDEEKTQASFILHPHTRERLYRTGDVGRYLPDGNIEFLGREDFQVKVQGHRIELGEIEQTLLLHPAVHAAVATAVTEPHGDKRLVAYVVLRESVRTGSAQGTIPTDENYGEVLHHLTSGFGQTSMRKEIDKPVIDLAHPASNPEILRKYRERLSYREFLPEPIPFWQFSDFLSSLSQVELEGLPKYRYPSAGGIYPVQTYVSIKAQCVEGVLGGIYYFNPQSSQLVMLSDSIYPGSSIHAPINQPIFCESAFSLFLIGDLTTISLLYGEAARDFCLLEAGYMSQLLMMTAAQYQIGLCPVGGLDFRQIRDGFMLTDHHLLLHTLLGGRVDPSRATGWSFLPLQYPLTDRGNEKSLAPGSAQGMIPTMAGHVDRLVLPVTSTMLRSFLKEKLPEYMLPSDIMVLDCLPLTANGKVDRKNLPMPQIQSSRKETGYRAPTSKIEQTIAAVWQEVLPAKKVGIYDNFFDLGGNSLLMVRAYTKLCKVLWHYKHDLSIIEMFFQYPTIHALAEFLTPRFEQQIESSLPHNPERQRRVERRNVSLQQERLTRLRHRGVGTSPPL